MQIFLSFPVLAAACAILGALFAQTGLPFVLVFVPVVFALIWLLWLVSQKQKIVFVTVLLALATLLTPITTWRFLQLENAPDPFENLAGKQIGFTGDFDGTYFHAQSSDSAEISDTKNSGNFISGTLLVAPRDAIAPGRWHLQGKLETVRAYKNFGNFDYAAWLARRGVHWRLRITSSTKISETVLQKVRAWLMAGAGAGLSKAGAGFMVALTVGETGGLRDASDNTFSWRDVFSHAGLGHLLALSGQQVTMLAAAITLTLFWLGVWRYPVVMVFLLLYWWVVGASASVSRAVISALVVLLNLWLGRGRVEASSVVAWSVLIGLLIEPRWVSDAGFLLSHLAVVGMFFFGAPALQFLKNKSKPVQYVGAGLAATLGAELLTLPITASAFGVVPLFAPVVNLLVEPISLLLVPLGFLAAALGPQLGGVVNIVVSPLAEFTLWLAKTFAGFPVLPWGVVSAFGFLIAYVCIAILLLALYKRVSVRFALLVLLSAILLTALPNKIWPKAAIDYLDVGQGDGTLLRLPGANVLLDAGGTPRSQFDIGKNVVLPALRAAGIFSLRAAIATHADVDHMEGLIAVLENVPVGVLIVGHGKPKGQDAVWDAMLNAARKNHVPVQFVRRGESWNVGNAKFLFLHPRNMPYPEDNWNSVSFVLEYKAQLGITRRLLFLGDSPSEIETQLHPGLLDVLKLAHHGSRFSTSEILLNRTKPRAAVISAGAENRYGHPTDVVLQRLKIRGVRVYRTDRDGAVRYNLETGKFESANPNVGVGEIGRAGWRPSVKK